MKKTLAFVLALTLILSLAACGGNASSSPTTDADTAESEAPVSDTATPELVTGESELKTGVLQIGAVCNTSGWFAILDSNNAYETTALANIINEEGGVQIEDTLYTIDLVVVDGRSEPDGIRQACISLADAGVEFVVETNDFWMVSGQDVFEEAGIMHVCAYAVGDPDFMDDDKEYAFTATNGTFGDYAAAITVLTEQYPECKKIVYVNNDDGTNDIVNEYLKSLGAQNGLEIIDSPIIYTGDTTDYAAIAMQVINSGADAFISSGTMDAVGGILKEMRASGSDMLCASTSGVSVGQLALLAGEEAAYNAFTLGMSFDPANNTEIFNKLYARIVEQYDEEVAANFSGYTASCLYTLLDVMKSCGSIEPDVVKAAWENGDEFDSLYGMGKVSGSETYGIDNHALSRPTPFTYLENGEAVFGGWIETYIP